MTKKPSLERLENTNIILHILLGDNAPTYHRMSTAVGDHVHGGYTPLQSALRIARNQHNRYFKCTPGVGYVRLTDAERHLLVSRDNERQRRQTKRTHKAMVQADMATMTPDEQKRHTFAQGINAMKLEVFTKMNSMKKTYQADDKNKLPGANKAS
jgi:hypothetical protein